MVSPKTIKIEQKHKENTNREWFTPGNIKEVLTEKVSLDLNFQRQ